MKKSILLFIFISIALVGSSQEIYEATSGVISFFSEAPIENIEATNTLVKGLINFKNNEFAFITTIVGFHFKKSLMEQHFNENYMESDKYKIAIFKGKIIGDVDYTINGEFKVKIKGILNIHGVEKEREIEGKLIVKDDHIKINSEFNVTLDDHKIKIPKLVVKNIAETVKVTIDVNLEPKKL